MFGRWKGRFFALVAVAAAVIPFVSSVPQKKVTPNFRQSLAQLPITFEANLGQTDPTVAFIARGVGSSCTITRDGLGVTLNNGTAGVTFSNANPMAKPTGIGATGGCVNYYLGNDPKSWLSGVPVYDRVLIHDVYRGIDLVYYGNQHRLEYDLQVHPGADPSVICMNVQGNPTIDADGNLILADGVMMHAPVIYQERTPVTGGYLLDHNQVTLTLGEYDRSRTLVIDPILSYSTYLGADHAEDAFAVAVDSAGRAYVVGSTASTAFPPNPIKPYGGYDDAFVVCLKADGSGFAYTTYLGGSMFDEAHAIALDSANNAYIFGQTSSANFPTKNAYQPGLMGGDDAFVAKLDSGGGLVYSTYLGGSEDETARAIAVNSAGNAYVFGETKSQNFPLHNPYQGLLKGKRDTFLAKLNASGNGLVFSTYLGGTGWNGADYDRAGGIALDGAGNIYLIGSTTSPDFPTKNAYQSTYDSSANSVQANGQPLAVFSDVFITKFKPDISDIVFSTFLGGKYEDVGNAIAVDSSGNIVIAGASYSPDFPLKNPIQGPVFAFDAFVAKLKSDGSDLIFSTFIGDNGYDSADAMKLDGSGNIYIAGTTNSTHFPVVNPIPGTKGGQEDGFITKIKPDGSGILFSTYLGGSEQEFLRGLAIGGGNIYVCGRTASADFPTKNAITAIYQGNEDGFVTKISE